MGFFYGFDMTYLVFIVPCIIITLICQVKVKTTFSIPGKWGYTVRPDYVKVKAQDRHGDEFVIDGKDLLAKAFCHELDHLEGILFTQVATRMLTPAEIEEMNS